MMLGQNLQDEPRLTKVEIWRGLEPPHMSGAVDTWLADNGDMAKLTDNSRYLVCGCF